MLVSTIKSANVYCSGVHVFRDAILVIFRTSLALRFICSLTNLLLQRESHCIYHTAHRNYLHLYFSKHAPCRRIFQIILMRLDLFYVQ
jgi:hypothetical protein